VSLAAVIFDLDGLLVDSEPKWDEARAAMAAKLGKPWNENDHQAVMGLSTEAWARYMRERWSIDMTLEAIITEIIERMQAYYREQIPFRAGAVETVQLVAAHYQVALASGSERSLIDIVMASPELRGCFEVVVSSDEVARGKPEPDVYLAVAEQLGVTPAACVCLEDSKNGILSGLNAGMKVIAIPDANFPVAAEVLSRADRVLTSLYEVDMDMLRGMS
jgi:HAD superfamily hydrolase (TIGR01509 family)